MTKKNILLGTIGLLSLATLYAFNHPESVNERVFTLFFPEKAPTVAKDLKVQSSEFEVRSSELQTSNLELQTSNLTPVDTFPPLEDRYDDFINTYNPNPIDLKDPKVIQQQVEYDPVTNMYIVTEKIGDDFFRTPTYMTFDEYLKWRDAKQQQEYFDRLQGVASGDNTSRSGIGDPIAKFDVKNSLVDRLFGGTNVDIRPQGNINLKFGFDYQKRQNPILTLRQQRYGNFDFDMDINISAAGKIGEKLNLNFNYNTQATFDIDNQMKLNYDTKNFSEDEIIQNVEAGNVSLPLRSNLIKGAQNLFGFKTTLKFGHLNMTLLAAQQRSRQNSLAVQGGSQIQTFERPIDEYDENRHFFISHWNRSQFEPALMCLPVPQSLFTITRMEVWITNDRLVTQDVRDIVALQDLAEPIPFLNIDSADLRDISLPFPPDRDIKNEGLPTNKNNQLYPDILTELGVDSTLRFSDKVVSRLTKPVSADGFGLKQIRDFEKVRARLLSPSEYTFNDQLGFVSINLNVQPDQVVGVALEYTYNGNPYKIGEFTSEVPNGDSLNQNVLFVKMLKSTTANVRFPIWDLMMKNVYSIGSVNVDPKEFRFDILYEDPGKGQKRFLNGDDIPPGVANKPLLQVFRLDTLNLQGDPGPDGIFDFVPGLTINLRNGRIMFPVLEPFGSYLGNKLLAAGAPPGVVEKYAYPQLYDSTLFRAREYQQLNRFTLRGTYKSSTSSEISLGTFNLPQGSVRVTAGGRQLIEGADYIVDYNIGKVKILNDAILQSGQSVNVSFEDNTLFGFQSRTMLGARFDYTLGKDINIGATYMNLFERPLTQKVNFGDDPINNKMFGADFSISKEAPWLTKLVDKIPLINTKEPSTITAQAEVAALKPGHSRAINQGGEKGGIVYIDDFEGSTSNLPLANPANSWALASVPQGDDILFPESKFTDSLVLGVNRSRLSWYIADPIARTGPDNPYTTLIQFQDIFPNRQLTPLEQSALRPLDVTIFPRERGPYNYDLPVDANGEGYPGISKGLTSFGELNEPETRWAGFMKGLNTNDFEASNIEFIEFWVLNPYMDKKDGTGISTSGDMYIDLGAISEDIMRDSRQYFENAMPTGQGTGATAQTKWGRVPVLPPVVNAFDNDPAKRGLQDVGLDGLSNTEEAQYFADWLQQIQGSGMTTEAKNAILADPSNDDFRYFRDPSFADDTPLTERYRRFNSPEGNSPVNNTDNLNPSATNYPDSEDLNRDNSLNESEAYFRYKIQMKKIPVTFNDGKQMDILDAESPELRDFITDTVVFDRGDDRYVWYRFKVPLDYNKREKVGGIQDFRSIRFVRMLWKGFSERTTFRFATLELGRNQWRRFSQALPDRDSTGIGCDVGAPNTPFDVNAVSIEENAARAPFNYTIPYGISREQSVGAFPDILQNEQALSMSICSLGYCDARAIFKTLNMDLRQFKRLKMFVHAEQVDENDPIDSTDLTMFIRMGSDFFNNYYEYEIPLMPSNPDNIINGNPESRSYKEEVWRPENNFDFPLQLLTEVKKQRNKDTLFNVGNTFSIPDPDNPRNRVKIVGNPNLGYVKGIMVGVRNVDKDDISGTHCVETWINELRLNGFNEQGGYAGQARVDIKLADLGNVSVAGNYSSIGWGSIEQKLIQRQREEIVQYDISTNLELGKFLPEKSGLRIPFYAQYSNITKNPEYDPYDLDIKLKDKINNEADPTKRDEIRSMAQDITTVRGFNFTNVRKERTGGARKIPLPWNIENFSLTYAFNQQRKRDPFIINDQQNQYKGGLDYQYATGLKPIQPFKKLIKKDKYFKWITEINFNPIPNTYGFNTNLERLVQTTTYRFAGEDPSLNTYYNRRFTWDRNYDLGWDITKNLRFNFDATARSLIDEPQQYKSDGFTAYTTAERRDSIWQNVKSLGRPKNYTHNASLNYTLPLKMIPLMDWITVKASYTGGYNWTAQSLKLQYLETPAQYANEVNMRSLGNVIQNNSVRQINGEFNFETLYNKSKYLAKINKPAPKGSGKKSGNKDLPGGDDDPLSPGGMTPGGKDGPGSGDDRATSRKDRARDPGGKPGDPSDPNSGTAGANNSKKDKDAKDKKDKKKDRQPSMAERIALRPLMMVRRARATYSENFSTVIPGFTPDTKLMGLSEGFAAPGWAFVAGMQPESKWLDEAADKGWITHRPELNQQVLRNYTQNMDASATIEPFPEFRVELNANRQFARNSTELFKDQIFTLGPDSVDFQHRAARDMGSFTVSYFTMKTLFNNDINGIFKRYTDYRPIISNRLGQDASNTNPHIKDGYAYTYGFGKIQQEVLIPAFIAAYAEKDPNSVGLDIFKTLPAVNWKLSYNGLAKLGNLSKVFASIQITHGYKNTLTVNSYNTDLFYNPNNKFVTDELTFNYIARYEIPQVLINEQMSPLLGVDVKLKNDMTFKLNFKKSRMLAMSFIDYQLAESRVTGYTFGFGYRLKNVEIPFLKGKKKSRTKKTDTTKPATPTAPIGRGGGQQANDMTFKIDFDLNDDITVNHRLDQLEEAVPTRGGRKTTIDVSVDYALNRRLTLRLFTKYDKTVPKTSQSFPITTISSGVAIQFQLN